MPRLLSVNNYHYRRGGSDVVYLEHAALLEKLGWRNAFFSMHHPKNFASEWSEYFVEEIEFGHNYSLVDKVKMASKIVYSFEAQKKIKRLVNDFKPDVAHLHCIYHHLSPAIIPTLKSLNVPVVMTAHDLKIACPAYKMLNETGICEKCKDGSVINVIKHRCLRNSLAASAIVAAETAVHRSLDTYKKHIDRIVVPSQFFMKKFVEWGWPVEKFVYIPNYVDVSQFEPAQDAGAYFLYFGRLAPEKGVATLIHASHQAGVPLKIAGTGPIELELKALTKELGSSAEFLGYRSGGELHDLIRGARAVVLPSEWYENAPMSVLESFALGKPVIGADIGGIPEMVINGTSGWTFTSGNVDDLTEVLRQVAGCPDDALVQLGYSARQMVAEHFNREQYVNKIQALYSDLGVQL
ncbi:glycosyltransferase family 4 protein [Chitinibacter sp. ZOR0017]|uniref:glycosyltransferase family 4 protein n=1 Tax=Chitinibacter sp. ZOR0017 TaxID=1339254 RepID=UPI000646F88D|nr:glycosyltransferase family 4 protein [Chitinibacter sp. ZOR0017]